MPQVICLIRFDPWPFLEGSKRQLNSCVQEGFGG